MIIILRGGLEPDYGVGTGRLVVHLSASDSAAGVALANELEAGGEVGDREGGNALNVGALGRVGSDREGRHTLVESWGGGEEIVNPLVENLKEGHLTVDGVVLARLRLG